MVGKKNSKVQLQLFADASDFRLFVIAYLRIEVDYEVRGPFVMGKIRVASIETTTNLKPHAQAALHASKITVSIIEEHDFTIDQVFMWSDSTTVIQWLNSFDKKHQIFVANSIEEILENTKPCEWNHVSGIQGPADLGTQGWRGRKIATSLLVELQEKKEFWPKATIDFTIVGKTPEASEIANLLPSKTLEIQWQRFSSWSKLVNALAYIVQWRNRNLTNGSF